MATGDPVHPFCACARCSGRTAADRCFAVLPDPAVMPCGCYAPEGDHCHRHSAPPAADEVREAAERCRMRVEHAFDPDCPCDQNTNCYAGAIADMDALLSALAARGGA